MAVDMSQHFSIGKLLRFTAPSVGMMVFMSVYSVVDGFFVSNFVGSSALAAVNFAFPVIMMLGTIGYMMGTGGSAIIGKVRGEGDGERANQLFSLFVYASRCSRSRGWWRRRWRACSWDTTTSCAS